MLEPIRLQHTKPISRVLRLPYIRESTVLVNKNGNHETTIDIVLASEELASTVVKCTIHSTEHGRTTKP